MKWLSEVKPEDYTAAQTYLTLKFTAQQASDAVTALQKAPMINLRANDILRACGYTPLSKKDPGVKMELENQPSSPVLIVSYEDGCDIADGFHRVNAAYIGNPFDEIPAKVTYIEVDHDG